MFRRISEVANAPGARLPRFCGRLRAGRAGSSRFSRAEPCRCEDCRYHTRHHNRAARPKAASLSAYTSFPRTMSSLAARSLARNVVRQSRAPLCSSARLSQKSSAFAQRTLQQAQRNTPRAFSTTMIPKSDAMAVPAPPAEFDKEIVDMARYASNYKVDSELAVRSGRRLPCTATELMLWCID